MWPEEEDDQAIAPDAMDLITKLLTFQPAERLGHTGSLFFTLNYHF